MKLSTRARSEHKRFGWTRPMRARARHSRTWLPAFVGAGIGLGLGTVVALRRHDVHKRMVEVCAASTDAESQPLPGQPESSAPQPEDAAAEPARATPRKTVVEALTMAEVLELPATVDLPTAARALGFGRSKAYALMRAGAFPCRVLHAGETYRVPTAEILALLGIDVHTAVSAKQRSQGPGGSDRS